MTCEPLSRPLNDGHLPTGGNLSLPSCLLMVYLYWAQ